jgi:uncharacterized membrane protein YjjB (DUF3815 family)
VSKSIISFSPHKTALTVSILFAVTSLIFMIPMALMFAAMPGTDVNGNPVDLAFPLVVVIVMPFFYFVFGYISTVIGALIYNQVAKFTGGIRVEVADSTNS